MRAMDTNPEDRYADVAEFAADLRRALQGETILAGGARPFQRLRRLSRRDFLVGSSSVVGLAGLGAWFATREEPRTSGIAPRRVWLRTEPAGARIVVVPVSDLDGTPQPDRLINAGQSPVSLELVPGDYWIVADLPGYGFHEVMRHVPEPYEMSSILWPRRWVARDGAVELHRIQIPRDAVHEGMASLRGGDGLQMGTQGLPGCIVHRRTILPYYLEHSEFSVGDFRRLTGGPLPHRMASSAPSDDAPLIFVSHDEALHLAEMVGKRLPDEWEYELAITGASTFIPVHPRLAEWTSSWVNQPPYVTVGLRDLDRRDDLRRMRDFRVTRNASGNVDAVHSGTAASAFLRTAVGRANMSVPTLGFRCARSAAPRLRAVDWQSLT